MQLFKMASIVKLILLFLMLLLHMCGLATLLFIVRQSESSPDAEMDASGGVLAWLWRSLVAKSAGQ